MERKHGFYWVRINEKILLSSYGSRWIIAMWQGNWLIPGFFDSVDEALLIEIDEKRITK